MPVDCDGPYVTGLRHQRISPAQRPRLPNLLHAGHRLLRILCRTLTFFTHSTARHCLHDFSNCKGVTKLAMPFTNHREINRKERSREELNTMCREYQSKCSPPIVFNLNDLSPSQRSAFSSRVPARIFLQSQQEVSV